MQDRRENARDKVIYGGVAEIGENGASRECIVRNISDKGASVEFSNTSSTFPGNRSRCASHGRAAPSSPRWCGGAIISSALPSAAKPRRAGFRSGGAAAQERNQEAAASAPHQGTARRTLTGLWRSLRASARFTPRRASPPAAATINDTIAPLILGLVQRLIGRIQQGFKSRHAHGRGRKADTGRDLEMDLVGPSTCWRRRPCRSGPPRSAPDRDRSPAAASRTPRPRSGRRYRTSVCPPGRHWRPRSAPRSPTAWP